MNLQKTRDRPRGYPDRPSVRAGETFTIRVSVASPWFRVEFYRQGTTLALVSKSGWFAGSHSEDGPPSEDWSVAAAWKAFDFLIPTDWRSGAYIAVLIEGDSRKTQTSWPDTGTADARDSKILFIVRNAVPTASARILYKISTNTFHAYNFEGGGSLYDSQAISADPAGYKVTMRRPGGGTGGVTTPSDSMCPDPYCRSSPRQTFAHWDGPFIAWLETNGYNVDYCTDLDVHENTGHLLSAYDLLLSVGHDEYWSEEMRSNVEKFISNGGNVAFLSGNTCWWRIRFVDSNTAFVCDKSIHQGERWPHDNWFTFNPENGLTGVSYRNGGGWWHSADGGREPVGYRVQHAEHWAFAGTGLQNGMTFGSEHREALVGYECDGAVVSDFPGDDGFVVPALIDGTPKQFLILGLGILNERWVTEPKGFVGKKLATMGVCTSVGMVFTAATTDWVRLVVRPNPIVERITHNVISRLSRKGWRRIGAACALGEIAAATKAAGSSQVFATDVKQRRVWHALLDGPRKWEIISDGCQFDKLAVGVDGCEKVHVFAIDTEEGRAWHAHVDADGNWLWEIMTGAHRLAEIAAATSRDRSVHVFAIDTEEGRAWHAHADADGNWLWEIMTGAHRLTEIAAAASRDGSVHVFAIDTEEGRAWHAHVDADGNWLWEIMTGAHRLAEIAAATSRDGSVHVFAIDTEEGRAWHAHVDADGNWLWEMMDGIRNLSRLAIGLEWDSSIVCSLSADGSLWRARA